MSAASPNPSPPTGAWNPNSIERSLATATEPRCLHLKGQTRLPRFAVPRLCELGPKPDLAACTFAGTVDIDIDITEPTLFLVLSTLDLTVDATGVVLRTAAPHHQEFRPTDAVLDEEDEILVLAFNEALPTGSGVLGIKFSSVLNDHMRGFYRSKYEVDGIKRNMAVTQFEAVEARRCLPSWDEPALKADEMEFVLTHPKLSIVMTVKQSIEQVRVDARWVKNMRKEHGREELIMQLAQKNSG